jgi:uncharacterized damage-inducible protein DinB
VSGSTGVAPFYTGWQLANEALVAAITPLTAEQLALPIGSATWPIWASVAHVAGGRAFWLCHVFKEPGLETTPFSEHDFVTGGWEDDLAHPRRADELVLALTSTWKIVEHALATWTPDTLGREAKRVSARGEVRMHTRQSVIMRMITHDAFHCGEISLILGSHGLDGRTGPNGPIDMWAGLSRLAGE